MKKIIKLLILLLVLAIFAFSNNKYIVLGRNKMKTGYELLIKNLKSSSNEKVVEIGKAIE